MTKWVRSLLVVGVLGGMVLGPWSEAQAALNAYLRVKGQKQGDIKGSVTTKGREGSLPIIAVNHEVVSPRDPASGLATGKRQHKPFTFVMELGKSTPLLYQALLQNEVLTDVELTVFAPGDKAAKKPLYTVKLKNATISQIRMVAHEDAKDSGEATEVSLTYQKIEWTWVDGGVTAQDDWETPVSAKPQPPVKK